MYQLVCDVAVIGGGPAGLAAAAAAREQGAERVLILERDTALGGILQQCIHPGFGLKYYGQELTGPEYAGRFADRTAACGVEALLDTMVLSIGAEGEILCVSSEHGMTTVRPKSIVLAMGCRERTRASIQIPGTRPAGIYTAGAAQRLLNRQNELVGRKVVLLGSGDIGMIMARRMSLGGAKVEAIVEIMPYLAGLTRNRVQCVDDFGIPLGVLGSVALNLLMSRIHSHGLMLAIWGANGYCQSLIWAPTFLIVSQSIPPIWRKQSLLLLNTASSAGTVAAFGFSSLVLWKQPWESVFSLAAVCMAAFAVLWVLGCRYAYGGAVAAPQRAPADAAQQAAGEKGLARMLVFSGGVLLILPAMLHGMLKDGITTWLPTYMTEVFSMPAQVAVAISIFLPIINMLGASIAYWLMLTIKNEALGAVLLFGAAGVCLLLLRLWGGLNPILTILLFALVTAAMMAVNVLFCSEVPVRFAYLGKAATVSGFYNSCGYLGAAASMYAVAYVSQQFGWNVTQLLWIGACVGAMACCAAALPGWNRFLDSRRNQRRHPPKKTEPL